VAVTADLATLRRWVGAVGTTDDANLQMALDASAAAFQAKGVKEGHWWLDDVQMAILLAANRFVARRRTPEGVGGMDAFGAMVRIINTDPDIRRLMAPHWDLYQAGVA
jgi:hypothetical protein